jgi:hypothetical protein
MEQRRYSVKGVDADVIEMLADLRRFERRYTAAILEDAIRDYWHTVFDDECDEEAES